MTSQQSYNLDECYLGRRPSNLISEVELNFTNPPKLYIAHPSPPSRAALMVGTALGLPLEIVLVDIINGENQKAEYAEKNPQRTVPLLEDNDFFIWDSHAISAYLVTSYGKNDDLYPKDPRQRALVDQRLHFDSGILFPSLFDIVYPLRMGKVDYVSEEKYQAVHDGLAKLEMFLDGRTWLAGDQVTIGDICAVATVSSLHELLPIDAEQYPNVVKWFEECQKLPYYQQCNVEGLEMFGQYIRGLIKS